MLSSGLGDLMALSDCALLPVVGGDLTVPLVNGNHARAVNLDYAASAPALESVAAHLSTVLPYYSSVHRGAGRSEEHTSELQSRTQIAYAVFCLKKHRKTSSERLEGESGP